VGRAGRELRAVAAREGDVRMRGGKAVVAFVEIPKGSRNKYEFDPDVGGIVLDRRLFTSMSYRRTTASSSTRSARTATRSTR
jgi:hypothetical protein